MCQGGNCIGYRLPGHGIVQFSNKFTEPSKDLGSGYTVTPPVEVKESHFMPGQALRV